MATIRVRIPDDVKREFEETFAGENGNAIIATLMRQAVARRRRQGRRAAAIEALLAMRSRLSIATAGEAAQARRTGRP